MTNRESCTHHFEHVKQTRPFTEREYMECSKCGLQNPLGLFQHHDVERDGPAVKADLNNNTGTGWNINQGHTSGPHLQWGKNIAGKPSHIYHLIKSFMAIEAKRKRNPVVKVRRKWVWIIFRTWAWECQICYISDHQSTWRKAYAQADRHARNHHRSK